MSRKDAHQSRGKILEDALGDVTHRIVSEESYEDLETSEGTTVKLPQLSVDLRVPLWGMVLVVGSLGWVSIGAYFKLNDLVTRMSEQQTVTRELVGKMTSMQSDQNLWMFRLQKVEAMQAEMAERQQMRRDVK